MENNKDTLSIIQDWIMSVNHPSIKHLIEALIEHGYSSEILGEIIEEYDPLNSKDIYEYMPDEVLMDIADIANNSLDKIKEYLPISLYNELFLDEDGNEKTVTSAVDVDSIKDYLLEMDEDDFVEAVIDAARVDGGSACEFANVYTFDEFDEVTSGMSFSDIAARIFYGPGVDPNASFVRFTGHGNYESVFYDDFVAECKKYIKEIANMFSRLGESRVNNDLNKFLQSEDEDNE